MSKCSPSNPMDYKQPSFYHFTEDSIKLAQVVVARWKKKSCESLLDLCAGCGVIGIEIANQLSLIKHAAFLEAQFDFIPFLEENIKNMLKREVAVDVIQAKLSDWQTNHTFFDLIVCNPPYFEASRGRASSDYRRQICRTFVWDGPEILLQMIQTKLTKLGEAFIVLNKEHHMVWEKHLKHEKCGAQVIFDDKKIVIYLIRKVGLD